jgi:hypothetical protein
MSIPIPTSFIKNGLHLLEIIVQNCPVNLPPDSSVSGSYYHPCESRKDQTSGEAIPPGYFGNGFYTFNGS